MTAGRILPLLLLAAFALGACGKKGDVKVPDGEKKAYYYPRTYPAPASVTPRAEPEEAEPEVQEEPAEERLEPRKRNRLSPFPASPDRNYEYEPNI